MIAAADASTDTDNRENVYAGYGQFTARYGKWGVLAGLRIESTHAIYGGNIYNADHGHEHADSGEDLLHELLSDPPGPLRYPRQPHRAGDVLVGYRASRLRPDRPGGAVSVVNATVTVGNPGLKPTIGQNFDLTLEYYPGDGQIAAAGLFYKDSRTTFCSRSRYCPQLSFPGAHQHNHHGAELTRTGRRMPTGFEAQYQQQLTFLPRPFNGFGYSGNVTLVDSRAEIHPGIFGLLPSTSQRHLERALFYERRPSRCALAADYVGQNLFAFGAIDGQRDR